MQRLLIVAVTAGAALILLPTAEADAGVAGKDYRVLVFGPPPSPDRWKFFGNGYFESPGGLVGTYTQGFDSGQFSQFRIAANPGFVGFQVGQHIFAFSVLRNAVAVGRETAPER